MFLLLLLTAITSLILGLGLPIIVAYVLLALLIAPALVDLGVQPLAAHLFIFYYGLIGAITPPVAPDAFVAAGIAKADPIKIAFVACRLGAVLYFLPFSFVYNPALLMQGSAFEILLTFTLTLLGTYGLACAFQGYILYKSKILLPERIVLFVAAILLIIPEFVSGLIGLILLLLIQGRYTVKEVRKKSQRSVANSNINFEGE